MRRYKVTLRSPSTLLHEVALGVGIAALVGVAGCGGPRPPVGRVEIRPDAIRLVYPQCTSIHLTWTPEAALERLTGKPRVFVHLIVPSRRLVRTFDHDLPQPWTVGKPQSYDLDLCQSVLAEPLAAGSYDLTVGLIDGGTGARFPLRASGQEVATREYRVATVDVGMIRGAAPQFEFSPRWHAIEAGADKQVLARRWLFGSGSVEMTGLDSAGALQLALRVPQPGPNEVRVSSTCGRGGDATLGPGLTVINVPVAAGLPEGSCEVRFAPSFAPGSDSDARAVGIESMAWKPAGT